MRVPSTSCGGSIILTSVPPPPEATVAWAASGPSSSSPISGSRVSKSGAAATCSAGDPCSAVSGPLPADATMSRAALGGKPSLQSRAAAEAPDLFKRAAVSTAEATPRKDRRMNVRVSERDMRKPKARAAEQGIPYQTLVTMVLHNCVTGRLEERR